MADEVQAEEDEGELVGKYFKDTLMQKFCLQLAKRMKEDLGGRRFGMGTYIGSLCYAPSPFKRYK